MHFLKFTLDGVPLNLKHVTVWRTTGGTVLGAAMGLALDVGAYTFVYAKGASYLTNDPKACVNCHDDTRRNWLLLVEAVTSAGAVDWKRRNELKELFKSCKAGLVFVTAFETRRTMQTFLPLISWETEVWVA